MHFLDREKVLDKKQKITTRLREDFIDKEGIPHLAAETEEVVLVSDIENMPVENAEIRTWAVWENVHAENVKRGFWRKEQSTLYVAEMQCSKCQNWHQTIFDIYVGRIKRSGAYYDPAIKEKYCPHCGAHMMLKGDRPFFEH